MSDYAWVDPTNTANISLVDFPPPEAGRGPVTMPNGQAVYLPDGTQTVVQQDAARAGMASAFNLYIIEPDTSSKPGTYWVDGSLSHSFSGVVGDGAAVVQEVWTPSRWVAMPLDEVAARKRGELDAHGTFVTFQSVRASAAGGGDSPFWIVLGQRQRERIGSINLVLTDRAKDRSLGEDTGADPIVVKPVNTYWARDPRLRLIRDSNGNQLLASVDEVSWGRAVKDIALYDDAVENAYVACNDDIQAQLDASDRAALEAIDVTSAAYGWPNYYTGPVSAGIRVVGPR